MPAPVEPLTLTGLATSWTFDPLAAVGCAGLIAAYLAGVRRLRLTRRWSRQRTAAFVTGVLALAVATLSGIGAQDTTWFSLHVTQHVLLGIVAPLLLALGAPVTLAVQATRRPTQVNLLRVLRSRPVAVIGHPVTAWLLFGATLFALYFTPLYELSLRNEVVHVWVHLHFVAAGCLYAWSTIGIDPSPHRLAHGAKLLLVVLSVPFHAFIGLALLVATAPLAADHYASVGLSAEQALADQRVGAAVMWLIGDLTALAVSVGVARQWWATEQRRTARLDARLDAERARSRGVAPEVPVATVTAPPVS